MQDVHDRLETIQDALDDGDFERAIVLASDAARAHPTDPDVRLAYGDSLWELGDVSDALEAYRAAASLAPRVPDPWVALARAHFMLAQFDEAREAALRATEAGENADAYDLLCRLAERSKRLAEADQMARKAHALDPGCFPLPLRVREPEFRKLVREALDEIPERFREAVDEEVALIVEPVPPLEVLEQETPPIPPDVLGLYVGIPRPERTSVGDVPDLPDRVYLFQHNLEHEAGSREQLIDQIVITLRHELGHYFGFTDEELEERDYG